MDKMVPPPTLVVIFLELVGVRVATGRFVVIWAVVAVEQEDILATAATAAATHLAHLAVAVVAVEGLEEMVLP